MIFGRKRKIEPTPITDSLRKAAKHLDIEISEDNGFLAQAEIIREIAFRIAWIESLLYAPQVKQSEKEARDP